MTHDVPNQTGVFATSAAGAFWWVVDLLYHHGPSWEILPPMLIGSASLIGAVNGWCNARQQRRHRDEEHQLELEARRKSEAMTQVKAEIGAKLDGLVPAKADAPATGI